MLPMSSSLSFPPRPHLLAPEQAQKARGTPDEPIFGSHKLGSPVSSQDYAISRAHWMCRLSKSLLCTWSAPVLTGARPGEDLTRAYPPLALQPQRAFTVLDPSTGPALTELALVHHIPKAGGSQSLLGSLKSYEKVFHPQILTSMGPTAPCAHGQFPEPLSAPHSPCPFYTTRRTKSEGIWALHSVPGSKTRGTVKGRDPPRVGVPICGRAKSSLRARDSVPRHTDVA